MHISCDCTDAISTVSRETQSQFFKDSHISNVYISSQNEIGRQLPAILHYQPRSICCPDTNGLFCHVYGSSFQNLLVRVFTRESNPPFTYVNRMPFHLSVSKLHVNTLRTRNSSLLRLCSNLKCDRFSL